MQKLINQLAAGGLKVIAALLGQSQEETLVMMILNQDLGQDEYNRLADLLFT